MAGAIQVTVMIMKKYRQLDSIWFLPSHSLKYPNVDERFLSIYEMVMKHDVWFSFTQPIILIKLITVNNVQTNCADNI